MDRARSKCWAQGGTRRGSYPHLGEIVEEFADRASNSPAATPDEFNDKLKEDTVRAEKTIELFLNTYVHGVEMSSGPAKRSSLSPASTRRRAARREFAGSSLSIARVTAPLARSPVQPS